MQNEHAAARTAQSDHELVNHLQGSTIYRDYQKAFEITTGLPLAIRPAGSFQAPLSGSRHANSFCALMANKNKTCAACLQLQQRVETEAQEGTKTLECFAGLSESSVPLRVGNRVVGFLQTGQVFLREPSEPRFKAVARQLGQWGEGFNLKQLKEAYFKTRVVAKHQYESVLHMVDIFAQHLSSLGNQIVVQETAAEQPAVAKARAYIAEHQSEEISLAQLAQAVHMSAFYFCKIFKKATGLTFTEYLARVRIETVKQLLLNPHKRISEAAYEAGFQSLSQFNRVFRRIAGESPTTFREHLHGHNHTNHGSAAPLTCAA